MSSYHLSIIQVLSPLSSLASTVSHLTLTLAGLGRRDGESHQLSPHPPLQLGDGPLHLLRLLHPPHCGGQTGLVEHPPSSPLATSTASQEEALTANTEVQEVQWQQVQQRFPA